MNDHPLQVPDEGRYARASQVMLESGDWLVPRLYGKPRLEKPPLVYWLQVPAIATFGANEFAVRLPSAAAATLTVLIIVVFGRIIRDTGFGLIAGFVSALLPLHIMLARMSTTDAVLNLFFTLAFFSGYCALSRGTRGRVPVGRYWTLFFLAIAGGLMTKGPVALLPVAPVVAWVGLTGTWRAVPWGRLLIGLTLAAVPLLAWSFAVWIKHPDAVRLWYSEIIERATGAGDHPRPIYFYLPVVLIGMFPATALLPLPGVHFSFAQAREAIRQSTFPAWCGLACVTWFAIFSLNGGKQTAYMLPLVAPIASVAAWQLRNLTPISPVYVHQRPVPDKIGLGSIVVILSTAWLVLTLTGTAGANLLPPLLDPLVLDQARNMAMAVFPAVAFAWLAWAMWRIPVRRQSALLILAVGLILAWYEAAEILEDGLTIPQGNPSLIQVLESKHLLTNQSRLIEVGYSDPTLDFYLDKDIEQVSMNHVSLLETGSDTEDRLLLVETEDWERISLEHPVFAREYAIAMNWHHLTRPISVLIPVH